MLLAAMAVIAGLVVLIWSADRFVDGAAATSARLGLSPLLIGMLVIGFGTSAPELTVSALAAAQGNPGLALGNAYGSNIANIGLILGLVAIVSPLAVSTSVIRRELPVLGVATLVSALMMLLVALMGFIGFSIFNSRRSTASGEVDSLATDTMTEIESHPMSLKASLTWTLIGLVLLIASSRLLVWGAVEIAQGLGVSDLIIGLTVVAVGTSLPELASSLSALRRNEHDLVVGNVVGSNLFNTLGVVGLAAVIAPVEVGTEVLLRDWSVMTVMTVLMAVFALGWPSRAGRITRFDGMVFLAMYIAYTTYMVSLVLT